MKKIIKVSSIEVKRCFILSKLISKEKGKKRYLIIPSYKEFEKKVKVNKIKLLKFSVEKLDKIIADEYKKRLKAYDNSDWYIGEVSPNEVGVWRGAGGLPLEWTNSTLSDTAKRVKYALDNKSKLLTKRAKNVIPNILEINVSELQKEKYLLPIIFKDGTGTNGRRRLKKRMKGDIDDGCMRSIAFTIRGAKKIRAYIGLPKKILK